MLTADEERIAELLATHGIDREQTIVLMMAESGEVPVDRIILDVEGVE